jgi:hypothetical protein
MNHDPSSYGGEAVIKWVTETSEEEHERIASHVGMITEILAQNPSDLDLLGNDRVVVCELFFNTFIRNTEDMVSLGPYNYIGILSGLEDGPEGPTIVFENLRTKLLGPMPDDSYEFEYEIVVSTEEIARVPVRDINEIGGISATPSGWEALSKLKRDADQA